MIFPDGFLSFQQAHKAWVRHRFEHAQLMEGIEIKDEAALAGAQAIVSSSIPEFCLDVLEDIPVHILNLNGNLHRISGSVCECFDESMLGEACEDFDECLLSDSEIPDPILLSNVEQFFSLPPMEGYRFLYIDPRLSIVDCSGGRIAGDLIDGYDAMDHMSLSCVFDSPKDFANAIRRGDDRVWRYREYNDLLELFGSVIFDAPRKLSIYEGSSICFCASSLELSLKPIYPLSSEEILRAISEEREAERILRRHMAENPESNTTKKYFRENLCPKIGVKALNRVWVLVGRDYPQLSSKGRRPKKEIVTP